MRISTVVMAAAVSLCATTALAAEGVGLVLAATNATSVSARAGKQPLTDKSELLVGDRVATGAGGQAQLKFINGMHVALSGNTSLDIDNFLDDPKEEIINIAKLGGSIRVVSDSSSEEKEQEVTFGFEYGRAKKVGTAFDLTVLPNGVAMLVLLEGKVELCDADGECQTVDTLCGLLRTGPDRDVEEVTLENGRVRETIANFPFLTSPQSNLLEPLRIEDHGCTDGGIAPQPLVGPEIQAGVAVSVGVIILCILLCTDGNGDPGPDTNNATN